MRHVHHERRARGLTHRARPGPLVHMASYDRSVADGRHRWGQACAEWKERCPADVAARADSAVAAIMAAAPLSFRSAGFHTEDTLRAYLAQPGLADWVAAGDVANQASRRAYLTHRFFAGIDADAALGRKALVIETLAAHGHAVYSRRIASMIDLHDYRSLLHDLWYPFALWLFGSLAAGRCAPLRQFRNVDDAEPETVETRADVSQGGPGLPFAAASTASMTCEPDAAHPVVRRLRQLLAVALPRLEQRTTTDSQPQQTTSPRRSIEPRRGITGTSAKTRSAEPRGCWWDPLSEPLSRLVQVEGLSQFREDRFWSGAFISSPVGQMLRANRVAEMRFCEVRTIDSCDGQSHLRVVVPQSPTTGTASWRAVRCGHSHVYRRECPCACPVCQSGRGAVARRVRWLLAADAPGEYLPRWTCSGCDRLGHEPRICVDCGRAPRLADVFVPGETFSLDDGVRDHQPRPRPDGRFVAQPASVADPRADVVKQVVQRFVAEVLDRSERDLLQSGRRRQSAVNRLLVLIALLPGPERADASGLPDEWESELVYNVTASDPPAAAIDRAGRVCCGMGLQPPPTGAIAPLTDGTYATTKSRFRTDLTSRLAAAMT